MIASLRQVRPSVYLTKDFGRLGTVSQGYPQSSPGRGCYNPRPKEDDIRPLEPSLCTIHGLESEREACRGDFLMTGSRRLMAHNNKTCKQLAYIIRSNLASFFFLFDIVPSRRGSCSQSLWSLKRHSHTFLQGGLCGALGTQSSITHDVAYHHVILPLALIVMLSVLVVRATAVSYPLVAL